MTALALACIQKRDDLVGELLRYGADVDYQNADGATILHTAASVGSFAIVRLLLSRGAPFATRTATGQTPLMAAAHSGDEATVRLLLSSGADPQNTDSHFRSALHWAAIGGDHVEVFSTLVEAGADLRASTLDRKTPHQYATTLSRLAIVDFISSREANESSPKRN
jgi:ankyrin repeat protein